MGFSERWAERSAYLRTLSPRSNAFFLSGVFLMFATNGLLTDVAKLGANSGARLLLSVCFTGGLAVAYVVAARLGLRWAIPLVVVHALVGAQFGPYLASLGPPLQGDALRARMAFDVNVTILAIAIGFFLISQMLRIEGTRYGRVHAEINLARDIHRRLVPQITSQVGAFEFRGVSLPSGEVGGDLIDLIESPSGWTCLVADVSGHGVAAGLLMGMVKSAARTQLRTGIPLDRVLTTMNAVLFELKSPAMFVTFVGLQCARDPACGQTHLRFSVAGHLPILHYRTATDDVVEVSIAQLPLAMFEDTAFSTADVACSPGDLFLLLTDGLTEVFVKGDTNAAEEFGLERVKALLRDHARSPLERLEERLLTAVRAFGPQIDDQTMFLVRHS